MIIIKGNTKAHHKIISQTFYILFYKITKKNIKNRLFGSVNRSDFIKSFLASTKIITERYHNNKFNSQINRHADRHHNGFSLN